MKLIDLFNKIANGEKIPKKIKWSNHIWILEYKEHGYYKYNYNNEEGEMIEDWFTLDNLNDEVEIIEEPKKIEELIIDDGVSVVNVAYKLNEIIDYINEKEKK